MKKFVYLFFASLLPSLLSAQIHEEPPKIITEIDTKVEVIVKSLKKADKSQFVDSNSSLHWTKLSVFVSNNKIVHISHIEQTEHEGLKFNRFYFDNNSIIQIQVTNLKLDDKDKWLRDQEIIYFDHDELMSKPLLLMTHNDTICLHTLAQKMGYELFEQNKHLQNYNPYKNLRYDSIVAYDFKGEGGGSIVYKNKLDRSAKNPKKLTPQQIQKLIATVTDTATYGEGTSACFDPHLGFVFYHKGVIKSSINVCFSCNYLIADEYLPAHNHSNYLEVGDDYLFRIPKYGFSSQGIEKLLQLCQELGLTYCKAPPSPFEDIPSPNKE